MELRISLQHPETLHPQKVSIEKVLHCGRRVEGTSPCGRGDEGKLRCGKGGEEALHCEGALHTVGTTVLGEQSGAGGKGCTEGTPQWELPIYK